MFREILRTDFAAGTLKTGVQLGAAIAQRRERALDRFFPFADVGIDLLLMGKIEGNCPVHLLEGERREVLANGLRRVSSLERIHDGGQGDTRAGDVESAITLFDIFVFAPISPV